MRWERLFEDLEAEWDAAVAADLHQEVRDRTRREYALVGMAERLAPHVGRPVDVGCLVVGPVRGRLLDVGVDWLLLETEGARETLVRLGAVLSVSALGQSTASVGVQDEVGKRLDLRWALRGLARSRSAVTVVTLDGARREGTLDRVGADHVELAEHPAGEPRRAGAVRQVVLVPVLAVVSVSSTV